MSGIVGRKLPDQSVLISYEGETLADEMLYKVEVSVADNHGNVESIGGTFETGIFDNAEFIAKMITSDFPEEETACPVFGKTFAIDKKVKESPSVCNCTWCISGDIEWTDSR